MRNVIKYGGIALVIVGIVLVMRNLFTSDTTWENTTKATTSSKNSTYSAEISLTDKESGAFISGAKLTVKNSKDEVVTSWTSDNGVHRVTGLKQGTYKLVEESVPEGYFLNSEGVEFKIKNSTQKVSMYNIAMTESEIAEAKKQNTTSSEVGVDNTASFKNNFNLLLSLITIALGIFLIIFSSKKAKQF